jgi:hypothetical protein
MVNLAPRLACENCCRVDTDLLTFLAKLRDNVDAAL